MKGRNVHDLLTMDIVEAVTERQGKCKTGVVDVCLRLIGAARLASTS